MLLQLVVIKRLNTAQMTFATGGSFYRFVRGFSAWQLDKRMINSGVKTLFSGVEADGTVALTTGAPGERHLAKVSHIIEKATQHIQGINWSHDFNYLQYGPQAGSTRFRQQLAKFLSAGYGSDVDSESLVVTAGATHGLHLVGSVLFQNKDTVFVEDPTYFIAINILKGELAMNVVAVPTDEGGIDPQVMEKFLQKHQEEMQSKRSEREVTEKRPFASMIYLIPTYHNPKGHCLSPERSKALVNLARKYDALIFCDDVYNLLHFDDKSRAPPRLFSYDDPSDPDYKGGNVLSNGTFSKIMAPGLRLGWIESGPRITDLLKGNNIMWSAGSANQFTSEIVASALELGEEQTYLKALNIEYKDTVAALCEILREKLPPSCTFNEPKGGYFIWLTMPEKASGAAVAKQLLEKHKIKVLQGEMCSAMGNYTNCVRISFSHYPPDVLLERAGIVCDVIREHVNGL